MAKVQIPTYDSLMNPVLLALKNLGGSGTIEEINNQVSELQGFSSEQLEVLHDAKKSGQTEIEYRLAWARTYLKIFGALENSNRGVWALTPKGIKLEKVDPQEVKRFARSQQLKAQVSKARSSTEELDENGQAFSWREELLATLQSMSPVAFERLIQRLLRESGFIQVEVTGRSGDGGIDGKGIMRLAGLLSFHVMFQCKRYKGTVPVGEIRDFRGAMVGRADKGLFVTTGNFTKDATREATRDGAPAIDLIDGDQLIDKLKELGLGVKIKKIEIEEITIEKDWFAAI